MEDYKAFVREHPAQVKRMEEMGRLVAMFLPVSKFGRFSEVVQESSYSILGLVSLYHDRIIQPAIQEGQNKLGEWLRLALTLFSHTEVVQEMLAKLFGGDVVHMRVIYIIEVIKAICRLLLLGSAKAGSMLLNGGQLEAKRKPVLAGQEGQEDLSSSSAEDQAEKGGNKLGTSSEDKDAGEDQGVEEPPRWRGRRSGKSVALPTKLRGFSNFSAADAKNEASVATSGVSQADGDDALSLGAGPEDLWLRMAGEVVHIIRPVVYVVSTSKSEKKKAWSPFVLSLALELLSMRCSAVAQSVDKSFPVSDLSGAEIASRALKKLVHGTSSKRSKLTAAEEEEIKRRRSLLALYLMRSPLFDKLTLPMVQRFAKGLSFLPAIGGSVESMMTETLMYYHRNHFYVSGS